jgi:hypothetical protein
MLFYVQIATGGIAILFGLFGFIGGMHVKNSRAVSEALIGMLLAVLGWSFYLTMAMS